MELAEEYAALLVGAGIIRGLIGPREAERIWERHIVNSLSVVPLVGDGCVVADIGSGAGLPGIVLAIARPDCQVELVESMRRRVDFLEWCVAELGLRHQVSVFHGRAEEYLGPADVLVCRAVAPVGELMGLVGHLVPPAEVLAIKGEKAAVEVAQASSKLEARGLRVEIRRPVLEGQAVGTVVRVFR